MATNNNDRNNLVSLAKKAVGTAAGSAAGQGITGAGIFATFAAAQLLNRQKELTGGVRELEFPKERPKYYLEMYIADYSRSSLTTIGKLNYTHRIILPVPLQIIDSNKVVFEEKPLAQSPIASGAIAAGQSALGASSNQGTSGAGDTAALGVLAAAGAAGPNALAAASAASGYTPNQFMVVLMKGPAFKTYELSWKLAPKNPQESELLRKIILLIEKSQAPGFAASEALFSFPKIFQMALVPNYSYLYRFKPAVIENVTVNYAGSGMPLFFADKELTGAPESVEIKLQFKEIEYWVNSDYPDLDTPVSDIPKFAGRETGRFVPTQEQVQSYIEQQEQIQGTTAQAGS